MGGGLRGDRPDPAGLPERHYPVERAGDDPLGDEIEAALRAGKSATVEREGARYFLTVQVPPVRLVMIGAVHISQTLAPIGQLLGYDVTIVDPRIAFASPERFPDGADP